MSRTSDAIVVGAGPAGAATAALLARRGLDVLLLERGRFPRDKLCGEFVSPDAWAVLGGLGLAEDPALHGAPPLSRFRLTAPGAGELVAPLEALGRGLSRRRLDAVLARRATELGARLREGCRVAGIERERGGVAVRLAGESDRLRARAVVDATGRSGLARPAAFELGERRAFVGFKRHHEGPDLESLDGAVEIHAFPGGYAGLNRVESGAVNLCVLVRSGRLRRAGGIEPLLERAGRANAALGARLAVLSPAGEGWLTTAGMLFRRPGPGDGPAFEVGDAAGMIAPVCGDGLGMALRSAELVAATLPQALDGAPDAARAAYRSAWGGEFARRLRLGRAVQAALLRPVGAAALVMAGRLLPPAVRWLVRGTRDWERAARLPLT